MKYTVANPTEMVSGGMAPIMENLYQMEPTIIYIPKKPAAPSPEVI